MLTRKLIEKARNAAKERTQVPPETLVIPKPEPKPVVVIPPVVTPPVKAPVVADTTVEKESNDVITPTDSTTDVEVND